MKQHPSLLKWVENESNNTQVSEITQGLSEWAKTDWNNTQVSQITKKTTKWPKSLENELIKLWKGASLWYYNYVSVQMQNI